MVVIVRLTFPCEIPRWATRALPALAAGLLLAAASTADMAATQVRAIAPSRPQTDSRGFRLEQFFKRYHCEAPYHTSEYLRAADDFGLDYRLLPAVSIRETSCGKAAKELNNFWGYHPGRQDFPSIEEGIGFLAQRLARHPLYKGKTLRQKLFVYNPKAAYPEEVERIMRQIE